MLYGEALPCGHGLLIGTGVESVQCRVELLPLLGLHVLDGDHVDHVQEHVQRQAVEQVVPVPQTTLTPSTVPCESETTREGSGVVVEDPEECEARCVGRPGFTMACIAEPMASSRLS